MFEECAREITANTIEGYNGTILAYGQTGAGKTFTMVSEINVERLCISDLSYS